ncbi:TraX family protein [Escherichia coli]|uniref:TraX family protein n=1 Tax=Escherichia coli TaxID=562 RepID=UPI0032DBAF71
MRISGSPAINRLWGWAVIAQFSYYLAGFPWYEGNILFAFAVGGSGADSGVKRAVCGVLQRPFI